MDIEYRYILVESFIPEDTSGKHGLVHIRALPGQAPYDPTLMVQCNKDLSELHPIGTKFRIKAKIVYPKIKASYISSHYTWDYEVINNNL